MLIWIASLALPLSAHGDDAAVIDGFHDALIAAMKSGTSFDERVGMLDPVVQASFDLSTIARVSLGRTWGDLDTAARAAFSVLLGELIVATYAERFVRYNEQRFETLSVDAPKPDRSVVKTRLVRIDESPVSLDYYLSGGRIYNIVADGVSDLSLRRADYAAIVSRKGFDGLLAEIRGKIADHRAAGDAP